MNIPFPILFVCRTRPNSRHQIFDIIQLNSSAPRALLPLCTLFPIVAALIQSHKQSLLPTRRTRFGIDKAQLVNSPLPNPSSSLQHFDLACHCITMISINQYLLLLAALLGVASAFWRMPCANYPGTFRLDPIVSPGELSSHAHTIHGGSGFTWNANHSGLINSSCTSCGVSQDNSAYW